MVWVRKGFVWVLSLLLLVCLVGMALAISDNLNLTHPQKIETWLKQNNVYDNLVTNALNEAQKSASDDTGAGRVSLNDPAVQQITKSVFTATLLQQYTSTFLGSNYAWLEGKTSSPDFKINLASAKQELANKLGQSIETRLKSLPACTPAQLAQLQATLNTDPLTNPCQLPGITPEAAAAQVTAQINDSRDFLNNTTLTAATLNPNGNNQSEPYFRQLSSLPKAYRLSLKLPWILGGLVLLSAIGIFFLAPRRRKGLRRIAIMLAEAGLILIIIKLVSNMGFRRLERHIFSNSDLGKLQQSLTSFLHYAEAQLVKVDFWFGIAYLVLAALLLIILWFTRERAGKPKPKKPATNGDSGKTPPPVFKQPQPPKPKRPILIQ